MIKRPEVSIIMNCYNGASYLSSSLQSIINQTFKNWELIFWNNSSTDKSKEIFQKFNDKRFKYFENDKTKKLYDVRNLAVEKAKGKYITFLDTDDLWVKEKLSKQLEFIKKKKIFFVFSNFYILQNNKKKIFFKKKFPNGKITQDLLKDYSIGILTVFMNKKLFLKNKFKKQYNIMGDFDFFVKLSKKVNMSAIQEPLAYYRDHSNNFSKLKLNMYYNELSHWIETNKRWIDKNNYDIKSLYFLKYKILLKNILFKFFKV